MSTREAIGGARQAEWSVLATGSLVLLALAVFPAFNPGNYFLHIGALVFVYIALGLGLNIVVGLAGLLDLGYVGFYAVGAYGLAVLTTRQGAPFWLAALLAVVAAALIGILLGWPTIRTSGDYLALVTLGFGEMIRLLMRNWVVVTNGPQGIMNVPAPSMAGFVLASPGGYYYLGMLMGTVAFVLFWRVKSSNAGMQLSAIRDDELAAIAVGINPVRWKLYAFALGAAVAGGAGVFFASWQRFVSPESFTLNESILVLCIVVLGGAGKLWPTVASAAFLVLLPEALRGLQTYRALVLGLLLVIVVILQEWLRDRRNRHKVDPAPQHEILAAVTRNDPQSEPLAPPDSMRLGPRLLAISGVTKSFGGVRALQGVSLEVRRGEVVGIVGANGAGKTTLFNCLAGSVQADRGQINWHGGDREIGLHTLAAHQRARLGVAHTFQQPRLFQSLTALQNVQLGTQCRQVPPLWDPLLARQPERGVGELDGTTLLATARAPLPGTPADRMSFVDQKLTELARALATRPLLLLLDEPAAGMELAARQDLARLLLRVNLEMGIAIIVVEHDLNFLNSMCGRLLVLDRGRLVADGAPDDPGVLRAISETYHQLKGGKRGAV